LSLAALGSKDEAWGMANMGKSLYDRLPLGEGYFGYVAGVLGHIVVEARSVVTELETRREKGYSPALPIAWTYLGLSETAPALDWLETALAERDPYLGSAMVFPGYDAIRDQARFRRLHTSSNFQPSGDSRPRIFVNKNELGRFPEFPGPEGPRLQPLRGLCNHSAIS